MRLTALLLRQFRNHQLLELGVDPGVNLFLGSNGAGKTNILEAIAVLATGVSPRNAESEAMIRWGETGFSIKGEFSFEEPGSVAPADPMTLEMKYRLGASRVVRQNDRIAVRLKDLLGKVPLVSFVPEDLALVKGEPDLRRRAINLVLMQADALYADSIRRYGDVLKSRNAALRQLAEAQISEMALEPWDQALIETGLDVCRRRAEFVLDFSKRMAMVHARLTGEQETLRMDYKPSFPGPWEPSEAGRWRAALQQTRAQELALGSTAIGPHRDDVSFLLDGRPARSFASEGQKRTCAVAFKLAEIPYIFEKLGQKPLCLLDDVLSELDASRAEHLLKELSRTGQCFVTMTGLESWPAHCELPASIFRVDGHGVHRETGSAGEWRSADRTALTAAEIARVFSTSN